MKRQNLYRASVFLAVIGLTLMYGASLYLNLEQVDIGSIEKSWSGRNVRVNGEVTRFHSSEDTAFIDLEDSTGSILVVNFDNRLELEKGDSINVTGYVSIYEGEKEVIAREIET